MMPGRQKRQTLLLCDFDGTLCPSDMGYGILEKFSLRNEWKEIDRDYKTGRIGSREAYRKVSANLRATRREMLDYVHINGEIDSHFASFYRRSLARGYDIIILSDGLDIYIQALLSRYNLDDIEYYANKVVFGENGSLLIEFPHSSEDCGRCGNCKLSILRESRNSYERIVYIGDGQSDLCPAMEADLVFAKGILYKYLRQHERDCLFYDDFSDIEGFLFENSNHKP